MAFKHKYQSVLAGWATTLSITTVMVVGIFFSISSTANAQVGALTCSSASFGSVGSALSSKVPVSSQTDGNTAAVKNIDCTWKGIAWQLAHMVLHSLTGSVVNWINSGFQGSPSFLTNPSGYFTNLGDQLTGAFISNTGVLSSLCSPFSVDVRLSLALGQAYRPDRPYTCTISSIINNVKNSTVNGMSLNGFMKGDFSQGGWPAFIAIGEPNNNEAGVYLQAQSDLLNRITGKQTQVNAQLTQGNGFLSYPVCNDISAEDAQYAAGHQGTDATTLEDTAYANADAAPYANVDSNTGLSAMDSSHWYSYDSGNITTKLGSDGTVTYQSCQDVTPGSVISSAISKSLGAPTDELNMTNDINQVVSALFSQLLTKTLSGGLFGASQSSSAGSDLGSLTSQLIQDRQGQTDAAALQGQAASEVQGTASTAQQAIAYRNQIISALTAEQALYQTTSSCIANELATATSSQNRNGTNGANQNNQNRGYSINNNSAFGSLFGQQLTPAYLQSELDSINIAIAGIAQQISAAQTNLATASSTAALYQNAADQIGGASTLNQANNLSNQYATQLSTIPYNASADPEAAQTDLNNVTSSIAALETSRKPYQTVCSGQVPTPNQ